MNKKHTPTWLWTLSAASVFFSLLLLIIVLPDNSFEWIVITDGLAFIGGFFGGIAIQGVITMIRNHSID